jgi:hypothetical protein
LQTLIASPHYLQTNTKHYRVSASQPKAESNDGPLSTKEAAPLVAYAQ